MSNTFNARKLLPPNFDRLPRKEQWRIVRRLQRLSMREISDYFRNHRSVADAK